MENLKNQIYIDLLREKGKSVKEISIAFSNGQFICPRCLKEYIPKHKSKEEAFKITDLESREQWLSHICSTKCWNDFLGVK